MSSFDWIESAEDMREVRAENEVTLALRRKETTVTAQPMRIEYAGTRAQRYMSDAARQAQQPIFILGEPDMDIAVEDRLTHGNVLFKVVFIQPNRLACTIAEGIAVE